MFGRGHIGYRFSHIDWEHPLDVENGNGISFAYGHNFLTKKFFTLGLETKYAYTNMLAKEYAGTEFDISSHQIQALLHMVLHINDKVRFLIQFGPSLDVVNFIIEDAIGTETTQGTNMSIATNFGFEFEFTKLLGLRVMFESNYGMGMLPSEGNNIRKMMEEMNAMLGVGVALKFKF